MGVVKKWLFSLSYMLRFRSAASLSISEWSGDSPRSTASEHLRISSHIATIPLWLVLLRLPLFMTTFSPTMNTALTARTRRRSGISDMVMGVVTIVT